MDVPYRLPLTAAGCSAIITPLDGEGRHKLESAVKHCITGGAELVFLPTAQERPSLFNVSSSESMSGCYDSVYACASAGVKVASGAVHTAGCIASAGYNGDAGGDTGFLDLLETYFVAARALKKAGVSTAAAINMTDLAEARAIAISCRRAGLPVIVCFKCDDEGVTENGTSVLAAMICLQELGISAFGLDGMSPSDMESVIEQLSRYSKVPLIACPDIPQNVTPTEFADMMRVPLDKGAEIAGVCSCDTEYISAVSRMVKDYNRAEPIKKADLGICLAGVRQPFFLEADAIECSEPVECSCDMTETFMRVEETSVDVITVDIVTFDDALLIGTNSYMASRPIMLRSNDLPILKAALLTYNGRAMIDSTCGISREELAAAAAEYGAFLY